MIRVLVGVLLIMAVGLAYQLWRNQSLEAANQQYRASNAALTEAVTGHQAAITELQRRNAFDQDLLAAWRQDREGLIHEFHSVWENRPTEPGVVDCGRALVSDDTIEFLQSPAPDDYGARAVTDPAAARVF